MHTLICKVNHKFDPTRFIKTISGSAVAGMYPDVESNEIILFIRDESKLNEIYNKLTLIIDVFPGPQMQEEQIDKKWLQWNM